MFDEILEKYYYSFVKFKSLAKKYLIFICHLPFEYKFCFFFVSAALSYNFILPYCMSWSITMAIYLSACLPPSCPLNSAN